MRQQPLARSASRGVPELILVTGANGFVGSALVKRLAQDHPEGGVMAAVRGKGWTPSMTCEVVEVGGIDGSTCWKRALQGMEVVVHCAARVHVMHERSVNPLAEFRKVNVEGTANLARQAAAAGVRRFVYLSSVKVNGESTLPGQPFTAEDPPEPQDAYAISKHEAEQELHRIAKSAGMELVIIRPPLVYGAGVKANFAAMMRGVARGVPLPLGAVTFNRRSMVALDNLVDLIVVCLKHPLAANQTFLVSDGEDLSTCELIQRMARALGTPARLVYLPTGILRLGAAALNRGSVYARLCGSLQVDISKTCTRLGWAPPITVDAGLLQVALGMKR
ncbi:SDR family oxidoreductase [Curvibacter sp. APW13]|uniref:UDP-glucose 4-epimerase family protein n=1 Tax=Curvibacter sp. APW13 TaxID=3077236 RepID=UPI0028DD9AC6|nr:SDR family oxidoreductase [Curvibacter sp. APW13]MDT8993084.1 SDR family oxidoreductase [Curvibacter sp. APW13]